MWFLHICCDKLDIYIHILYIKDSLIFLYALDELLNSEMSYLYYISIYVIIIPVVFWVYIILITYD